MKVLVLTSSLNAGGAERVATTISNAWAKRKNSVVLIPTFSGGGSPFYLLDPRIELTYLSNKINRSTRGKQQLKRLRTLRKILKSQNPDVVVSFLPNVNIAAIAATAFTGIPLIIGERSDPIEQPIGRFWTTACKLLYRFADAVTVQTESVAQRIGSIYGGLQRVTVIPNPLPDELVSASPREPDIEARTGRHVLLSVGRLSAEKRPDRIIEAFARVAQSHADWDLHLVGDGPLKSQLQQQIEACGLPVGRVQLVGRTSEPWKLMFEADAFVLASAYEGFPNALLEAVAIGLPCVSTDCRSGPREISDDGKVVHLMPPNDDAALQAALNEIMGNRALRRRLSAEGPASVKGRFSLPVVMEKWDELFRSLADARRGR